MKVNISINNQILEFESSSYNFTITKEGIENHLILFGKRNNGYKDNDYLNIFQKGYDFFILNTSSNTPLTIIHSQRRNHAARFGSTIDIQYQLNTKEELLYYENNLLKNL